MNNSSSFQAQDEEMYSREYSLFMWGLCKNVEMAHLKKCHANPPSLIVETIEDPDDKKEGTTFQDFRNQYHNRNIQLSSTGDGLKEFRGRTRRKLKENENALPPSPPPPPPLPYVLNEEFLRRFHNLFNVLRGMYEGRTAWDDEAEMRTRRQMFTHLQLGI